MNFRDKIRVCLHHANDELESIDMTYDEFLKSLTPKQLSYYLIYHHVKRFRDLFLGKASAELDVDAYMKANDIKTEAEE